MVDMKMGAGRCCCGPDGRCCFRFSEFGCMTSLELPEGQSCEDHTAPDGEEYFYTVRDCACEQFEIPCQGYRHPDQVTPANTFLDWSIGDVVYFNGNVRTVGGTSASSRLYSSATHNFNSTITAVPANNAPIVGFMAIFGRGPADTPQASFSTIPGRRKGFITDQNGQNEVLWDLPHPQTAGPGEDTGGRFDSGEITITGAASLTNPDPATCIGTYQLNITLTTTVTFRTFHQLPNLDYVYSSPTTVSRTYSTTLTQELFAGCGAGIESALALRNNLLFYGNQGYTTQDQPPIVTGGITFGAAIPDNRPPVPECGDLPTSASSQTVQMASGGPGTELKKILLNLGFPACGRCSGTARKMNANGSNWSRDNQADLVAEIEANVVATGRDVGWFSRFGIGRLLLIAIERSEGIPDSMATKATLAAAKRMA